VYSIGLIINRVRVKCKVRGARRVNCEAACEAACDWSAINRFPRSLPTILNERTGGRAKECAQGA